MIKYFEIPYIESNQFVGKIYRPADVTKEINTYANENNLEIVSIATYAYKGIYVAFKQRSNI